jgi:hypothetical protein
MSDPAVKLTAELVESFSGIFLSPRYDMPRPTPDFHRRAWAEYCSSYSQVVCVAPRDHAKSTALTFDYILAETLFRRSSYVILIGSTEENAAEQLSNIVEEIRENDDLRAEFGISEIERDSRTDLIVRMDDGQRWRVLARGAEQKIRGKMWNGKRPDLVVCDDMEDDEQVENRDRRSKFRRWFFRAAKQALSKKGRIRVHGTILHEDSLLSRLLKNKIWRSLFFKAHQGFDDFSEMLWPERWTEDDLRQRRQEFIEDGDAAGYSQEFLNDPFDNSEAFLRRDDFIPMSDLDYDEPKILGAAADFAVSKADLANRTSFTVGGKCERNLLHFLDFRAGRWDTTEWIDEMFSIQRRWEPETFWVEGGVIWKSIEKVIYEEMRRRNLFLNIQVVTPVKDKAARGTSLRKRHRAGATRWNTRAEGYEGAREELLRFTGTAQARLDDQFDSAALLSLGFDSVSVVDSEDFTPEEELEMRLHDPRREGGRSVVTGY